MAALCPRAPPSLTRSDAAEVSDAFSFLPRRRACAAPTTQRAPCVRYCPGAVSRRFMFGGGAAAAALLRGEHRRWERRPHRARAEARTQPGGEARGCAAPRAPSPSCPSWGRSRPPHCASEAPVSWLGPEAPRDLASAPICCHRSSGLSSDRSRPPQAFTPAVPTARILFPYSARAGPFLPPSSQCRRHPRWASHGLVVSGSHAVWVKATFLCGLSCLA